MSDNTDCIPGPLNGAPVFRETLLKVEDVTKDFPTNDGLRFAALKGFSLCIKDLVDKPQVVGLLGPSGAGKTTALRLISGLDKPTSGRVLISNGSPEQLRPVKLGDVGVVFQRYPLFDDQNVLNNLVEPARRAGMPAAEAKEKALRYLDDFGLVEQGQAWPMQLSGGQRQRVAILQQLMLDRHFVILDEPFSGLDPVNITGVIKLISEIANRHTLNTFIIITHDITSALTICDHVYLLGRVRDADGKAMPGSRVMKEYDLVAEGLAYHENIEDEPRFAEIRKEIKLVEFPKL
jgi:polar amino acid transport system ATP-binding protein/sulfate transport system ATP-binding protein